MAVLKRIGRFLTKQGKLTIYNSFIIANFNYCPLEWHFCSQASTSKMEKVQERARRFINNDFSSSVQALLASTNIEPLHVKRLKQMATEVFKIIYNIAPDYIKELTSLQGSSYNFRNEGKASLPRVNGTWYGLRSFRYEVAPPEWVPSSSTLGMGP